MAGEELLPNSTRKNHLHPKSKKCCKWLCQITSEAFLEEEDLLHYIGRVDSSLSKSVIGAILLVVSYALSVMSLTVGILRIGACACQPVLPTFLIVHGSAMSVRCLLQTCKLAGNNKREVIEGSCSPVQTFSKLCGILVAFWTITGTVWVYSIVGHVDVEQETTMYYCDSLVYWYSLVLVSIVLTGLVTKCVFIFLISMVYCKYENKTWYSQIMKDNEGEFV